MSYSRGPPLGRSYTYADNGPHNGPADSRYPSLAETSNSRKPPLGRSSTVAAESWYPPSPLAAPSSPPGPLHHATTWPPDSSSTSSSSSLPSSSTTTTCLPVGRLLVKVFKARNIKGDEFSGLGKADPYAKIKLGGKDLGREEKTSTHKDAGSNPRWNQQFTFYVERVHNSEYNHLEISLYNRNSFPRRDNFLGHLHILNMGEFISGHQNMVLDKWYPVFLRGKEKGQIMLGFDMIPMSEQDMLSSRAVHDLPESLHPTHSEETGEYQILKFSPSNKVIQIALQGASVALAVAAL